MLIPEHVHRSDEMELRWVRFGCGAARCTKDHYGLLAGMIGEDRWTLIIEAPPGLEEQLARDLLREEMVGGMRKMVAVFGKPWAALTPAEMWMQENYSMEQSLTVVLAVSALTVEQLRRTRDLVGADLARVTMALEMVWAYRGNAGGRRGELGGNPL